MAWWDMQRRTVGASPWSKPRLVMGDAFPKLEPTHIDRLVARMEREKALLSPVFEEQQSLPSIPALVVHVEIRFTDPVIRSRYCRSYGSSPEFEATNRICRGLARRIERCSEELLTRKDSGALEVFKGDTYDRKPLRFEMTFRIMRRGMGEWAERSYRSYQKQPLTVALTKEIILATHRMIGLFLRRHDEKFQWLDCPVPDGESEGSETFVPSRCLPLSLLSIPNSRFSEATQTFEFVPGYSIDFCFRSNNSQRKVPSFERRVKVNSTQTAPLTLFMSENLLWKAEQALNQRLDSRRREFEGQLRGSKAVGSQYSHDGALQVDLRICNNLGPVYSHVHRNISSKLALFQDREARDCDDFLCDIENALSHMRNEADAALYTMNDLEIGIVELKGVGWALRQPAKFVLGPETSHDRRTVRAALERVQTGIGDVIRGHNIAIHINARKRGHLVLDKAIVAHEKRGRPTETFTSREEEQTTLVARLKARIQKDIDKVFEDSCSIDDISEDEEDYFCRPMTPMSPEHVLPERASSPSSVMSSPSKHSRTPFMQVSPRLRAQRVFSLSRRSTESVRSIDFLKPAFESFPYDSSRPSIAASSQASGHHGGREIYQRREPLLAAADIRPARRSFSLVPGRFPSSFRSSNYSTPVDEQAVKRDDGSQSDKRAPSEHFVEVLQAPAEGCIRQAMTSDKEEMSLPVDPIGIVPVAVVSDPAVQQPVIPFENDESKDASLAVSQVRHSRMDTPDAFVDAREYVATPLAQETAASERVGMLEDGVRSAKDDDAFSTAPSTPELSMGGSSPRHSFLITPLQPRIDLEAKGPIVQELYPEFELGDAGVHLNGHAADDQAPKEDTNCPAMDESTIGENNSQGNWIPPQVTEVPDPLTSAHGSHTHDADGQSSAESTAPEARVVSLDAVMPGSFPPTRTPTEEVPTASPEFNNVSESASESQAFTGTLGAEFNEGSDSSTQTSDFPTPEVRRSDTDQELDYASVLDDSKLRSTMSSPNNVLESSPESEPSAIETIGSELGAGCGAEVKAIEDNVSRCVQYDASGAPPGDPDEVDGAEPKAVPSESEVPNEAPQGTEQVTENIPQDEGHECTDTERIPVSAVGSDADIARHDGGKAVDYGPGLITEEEMEPSATAGIPCEDVGSTEQCEHGPGDGNCAAQLLGTAGNGAEESYGPNPGTEVLDDSEYRISAVDTFVADPATNGTSVKDEVDTSDPVTVPEQTTAEPGQQNDSYGSAPTGTGIDEGVELDIDPDGMTGASLSHIEAVLDEDAGTIVEDLAPEPQATPPEVRDESSPDTAEAEEKSITVPMATEIAETSIGGQAIGEEAKEELIAVPTVAGVIGTEQSDVFGDVADDIADGGKEESITAPNGTGTTEPGIPEADLGRHIEGELGDSTNVSDGIQLDDESDTEAPVSSDAAGVDIDDELDVRNDGNVDDEPAPPEQVSELESGQQQLATSVDHIQGLAKKPAESGIAGSEPPIFCEELAKDLKTADPDVDDELSLRVDDNSDDDRAPEDQVSMLESGQEQLAQCVDQSQGLTEKPAESGTTGSEPHIIMDELIEHLESTDVDRVNKLEVRAHGDTCKVHMSKDQVLELEYGERQLTESADQSQRLVEKAGESEAKGFEPRIVMEERTKHLEPTDVDVSHELKVRVDGDTGVSPASKDLVLLKSGERQLGECVDLSQGPMETAVEIEPKELEHREIKQGLAHELDVQTTSLEQQDAYNPDGEAETGTEAVAEDHHGAEGNIFVFEAEIDQAEEPLGESDRIELKRSVPVEPDTAEPQPSDKIAVPEIPVSNLMGPVPGASTVQADASASKQGLLACIDNLATELPAADIPPSEPSPALSLDPIKEKPHLAPMPDLSKLFPAPTRASFSSDTTSFTSTTRNSVDTIRPSKGEQSHQSISTPEPDHTSSSRLRPATAGYLGIGLRGSRFVDIGLRGALGDVKGRRLTLPLQHMLDQGTMDGLSLAAPERPSAPASEAGSKGPRLRKRQGDVANKQIGAHGDGDGEVAVLPRMMMLLAGAMVIGKIMGRSMPE